MPQSKIKMEVPYYQTPNAVYDMEDLDIYEQSVYIYLCRCGNNGASAFPSYETIAKCARMSRRKVISVIDSLIQKEYIKKKARSKDGARTSNVYYVDNLVHRVHHGNAQDAPYKEPVKKKYTRRAKRPVLNSSDIEVLMKVPGFK